MDTLLIIIVLLPLAVAVLLLAMPAAASRVYRLVAGLTTAVTLVLTGVLFAAFDRSAAGFQFVFAQPWLPRLNLSFSLGLDGISMAAFLLTGLVAFAGVALARDVRERQKEHYILYLTLVGGAYGAFASLDLFFFYFFSEFEVLCAYLLIAGWGRLPAADGTRGESRAAMTMTLFTGAGAILVLLGLLGLWCVGGGTLDLPDLLARLDSRPIAPAVQQGLFVLFAVGFGTLMSMWPLHAWSPPAYAAAPTAVSMFAGGVLKQLGAYGLLRIAVPLLPEAARWAAPALAAIGTVNVLYGAWLAMRQRDWKRMIAYASISHIGYVLIGLAALNMVGLGGVAMLIFAGGLSTALLFALAGRIEEYTGDRDIARFGGLARQAPFLGVCLVMAAMAAVGLPGFAGFVGEVMVFAGCWMEGSLPVRAAVVAGVWGLVLSAVYLLWAVRFGVFGPVPAGAPKIRDPKHPAGRVPFLLLLAALLAVGVWPRLLTGPIRHSLEPAPPPAAAPAAPAPAVPPPPPTGTP